MKLRIMTIELIEPSNIKYVLSFILLKKLVANMADSELVMPGRKPMSNEAIKPEAIAFEASFLFNLSYSFV